MDKLYIKIIKGKHMKAMKLSILFFLMNVGFLIAQDAKKGELSIGVGDGTSTRIVYALSESFSGLFSGTNDVTTTSSGAFHASYKFGLSERFMFGAIFITEKIDSESIEQPENRFLESTTARTTTFAVEADFRFVKTEYWQMYSGLGLGYTSAKEDTERATNTGIISDEKKGSNFNGHLNVFSVRYGKSFGVFAGAGFGYKGILNAGLSFQF